ncbi:citrate (pro-3S)-lyase subunit beta [soil metagenome]
MFGPALLFCPADRPERYAKAAAAADTVIIDLEDAVSAADRPAARVALAESSLDPARTIVRVNPVSTDDFERDLTALAQTDYATVMLAKTEQRADAAMLADYRVVAICETALGVQNAAEIAAADNVFALMWGAEDLVASLGGTSSRDLRGGYRDVARYARSRVLIAAAAHGKHAVDTVHLDIPDIDGLRAEAEDAVASGFAGTACIHPSQVPIIRSAYAPTAEELRWAAGVLSAAESERGVFRFEGRMIDEPILRQARRILRRTP